MINEDVTVANFPTQTMAERLVSILEHRVVNFRFEILSEKTGISTPSNPGRRVYSVRMYRKTGAPINGDMIDLLREQENAISFASGFTAGIS